MPEAGSHLIPLPGPTSRVRLHLELFELVLDVISHFEAAKSGLILGGLGLHIEHY